MAAFTSTAPTVAERRRANSLPQGQGHTGWYGMNAKKMNRTSA
jgi:hypothetical protein